MSVSLDDLPVLKQVLQEGIDRQLHTGVQLYVSLQGRPLLNCGFGTTSSHATQEVHPVTVETSFLWRSAGKPLTAALVLRGIELGHLKLDDPLQRLLPEFQHSELASVTLVQLLTHTSGFPTVDTGWPHADWGQSIDRIRRAGQQLPAGTAAYHPLSSWFLLGEILLRQQSNVSDFSTLIQAGLLKPIGMSQTASCLTPEQLITPAGRIPILYDRVAGKLIESDYNATPWLTRPAPGGSLRGPVAELGRFYEMLARGGQMENGERLLEPESVQLMTARHRTGEYDQTFQHIVDFGLGVIVNSQRWGIDTVPYGFARHCSDRTFGHGGAQCSIGYCDPETGLVVAWATNGFCGEGQHQRRNRAINEAIWTDVIAPQL